MWMINDLEALCRIWKFMDDTTLSEAIAKSTDTELQGHAEQVVQWSQANHMNLNAEKTKELAIYFRKDKLKLNNIIIDNTQVEQVNSIKLLGLNITKDLKWRAHIDQLIKGASKKIYYLKHLKRAGLHSY